MKIWFLRKINSIINHLTKLTKKIGKRQKLMRLDL